jgi:hypothetical protein
VAGAPEELPRGGNIFYLHDILGHSALEMVKRYVQLQAEDLQNQASPAFATGDYRLSRVLGLTPCRSKTRTSKQAWYLIGETGAVDLLFLTGLNAMSARNKN